MSDHDIGAAYLTDALRNFRSYKKLAERPSPKLAMKTCSASSIPRLTASPCS
jgi:hypothetical protein